ncbi:MAG: glycoside hydrolase family 15 protein [Acidimicrobiia bacterium]
MALPIEDYAFLSDLESAALVGRDGSIDWLTFPRFDSPACFAALLGDRRNGRWLLAPAGEVRRVERRYRDHTLVLETTYITDDGEVTVVDCMPPRDQSLEVIRLVKGVRGRVPMRMELVVRFDYGSIVPWARRVDGALTMVAGPDALRLVTAVEVEGKDMTSVAEFSVGEGQVVPFVLLWHSAHQRAREVADGVKGVAEAERWWQAWAASGSYRGEWGDEVAASLTVLKGLTYAPTGGLVAAATTSLPEQLGGPRNWDYRYCWLRDATFSLLALLAAGYTDEATAWRDWLLRAVAGDPGQLQIMYGLAGERRLTESTLDWLPGYEASVPVRVGNAAYGQHQLDVYGEVMDALHQSAMAGLPVDGPGWALQAAMLDFLESDWCQPDEGIWEVRGPRRQFTHSKVMAWVALDRAVRTADRFGCPGDVGRWRALRDEVKAWVLAHGVDDRGVFVQYPGTSELDASLLMVPLVGFLAPSDERVRNTVEAIERELASDGFVMRYRSAEGIDGLPSGEGTFLMCSFWMAQALDLVGRQADARALFGRLLDLRNDVGLLAEEYDPRTGRMLGNFPQAFSHTALVNTAMQLAGTGPRRTPA